MSDIIHLLPDSIANQIAAGEVIQRPASVVKELLENSVDAGATKIRLDISEAGREVIKVSDNGKGMSPNDARMAFERHATSKISDIEGLFKLKTMGFRGEALASIAAVAQVELTTKQSEAQLGTLLTIHGSEVQHIEPVTASEGTIFTVRNLFYNVPARRKFLKTNDTEFRHIMTEFERVALVNPEISFSVYNSGQLVQELPAASLRGRILSIMGGKLDKDLLPVSLQSPLANVSGYVGRPEGARKRGANQFFFVNGRFMRHPYFHKALMMAYEQLIPVGASPNYFIYFNLDPALIDVNIHPTKTEIKFADEKAIWQLLIGIVRETLSSSVAMPSIDFEQSHLIDIPVYKGRTEESLKMPGMGLKGDYNPFSRSSGSVTSPNTLNRPFRPRTEPQIDWADLKSDFEKDGEIILPSDNIDSMPQSIPDKEDNLFEEEILDSTSESVYETKAVSLTPVALDNVGKNAFCYLYKNRYVVTTLSRGLALIDYQRAQKRVLYEQFLSDSASGALEQQQLMFPEIIEFPLRNVSTAEKVMDEMSSLGFDFSPLGQGTYSVLSAPSLIITEAVEVVRDIIDTTIDTGKTGAEQLMELIALKIADYKSRSISKCVCLDDAEILLAQLFASEEPTFTPDGKLIISIINETDIDKMFS